MRRAVFFDRDGVVNRRRIDDYVKNWDEFVFLPDIFGVLPEVHAHGFLAVIVSNQRGIARGLMTGADLSGVHSGMQDELTAVCGHSFDAIYHCPHDTGQNCDCRKPRPGMLLQAARELNIDLSGSWLIGDSPSDILAAHAAGCRSVLIHPPPVQHQATPADIITATLRGAWDAILALDTGGESSPHEPYP